MDAAVTVRTKKLINRPEAIIAEFVEGYVAAWPDLLTVEGPTGRAVVARHGPRDGKVGVVIGGGSGHEPAFVGYVGRGLADAAAVGNVFASPSPEQILDAGRAADGGAGVIFLYGNYMGDVMNFTMAGEELAAEGTPTLQFQVTDDIASAPSGRAGERRGVAGDFFVFKCAGAAADRGASLDEVAAMARLANENCRSMGVALGPCSLPQTAVPNFEIGPDEMEIGMGIHGEPGVRRVPLETADTVAGMLMQPIMEELALGRGDRVAVLVNGLGATTQLELVLLYRRVQQILDAAEVDIHARWVGEYATSLEMAGASITLLKLDDTLTALLDHPCRTPALTVGVPEAARAEPKRSPRKVIPVAAGQVIDRATLATGGAITPARFRAMVATLAAAIRENRDWLSRLDGVIGDGDHGVTMDIGWSAVLQALEGVPAEATVTEICEVMAAAFLTAVGASSGPLYAGALRMAGAAVSDRLNLDAPALARFIAGMSGGILKRGGAAPGDKTMVDAWVPAAEAAMEAAEAGADEAGVLDAAREAAERGAADTAALESRRGRSAKLGQRSIGHVDPGAASAHLMLAALATAFRETRG